MKLLLERSPNSATCCLGRLDIDGEFQCFTLEDVVRERPGQPVSSWKVFGKTAIPAGEYEVKVTHSQRFQRMLPQLMEVPGFEGVRIHPGNTDADTEGCILVGDSTSGDNFLGQSKVAFAALLKRIDAALINGESVSIEIRNA